jgi:predicted GNAT family acetyltransferase
MIQVKVEKGKNLDNKFLKKWNKVMLDAFNEDNPLNPAKRTNFEKDIFFIVSENNNIFSLGRLRPVIINFDNKNYNILGIADIVSIIKGKGYGKILLNSMLKYLKQKNMTGIGFCLGKNSVFYEKSKFKIAKNMAKLFVHKSKNGKLAVNDWDDDVIYYTGKDNFMKRFLKSPKKVLTSILHW